MAHETNDPHNDHFIEVAVSTTSGFFPSEGYNRLPIGQIIQVDLDKAAKELNLTDTTNWVVSINKKALDPSKSYKDNSLSGQVELDWGPAEGGGGNA